MFKIPLAPYEQWERLNDKMSRKQRLNEGQAVRVYSDTASARYECAFGLTQFLAHKRSVGVIKGQTNFFESLTSHFFKSLLNVQIALPRDIHSVTDWVDGLKKDTNFVVMAEDHPVTGELYHFIDELDALLNERKIYCIRLSHFKHRYRSASELRPYSVQIQIFDNLTLAFCGERFKVPPLVVHVQSWSEQQLLSLKNPFLNKENADSILSFVSQVGDIAEPLPLKDADFLKDRSLILLKDVSAAAVIQKIAEARGVLLDEVNLQSSNQCLWDSLRQFKGWWDQAPNAEQLASLLVVPVEESEKENFTQELRAAYQEVLALSKW